MGSRSLSSEVLGEMCCRSLLLGESFKSQLLLYWVMVTACKAIV